jgi:uncharacterized protein (DUF362 family)
MGHKVGIYRQKKTNYSKKTPYNPPFIFEEYPFKKDTITDKGNEIYASLRELFKLMGMDLGNFGSAKWNPFGSFILPGEKVLIKPNFMRHFSGRPGGIKALITHGSLIRAVADYVYIALKGRGRIIIADGPMDDGDFEKIIKLSGLDKITEYYRRNANFELEIYDLRQEKVLRRDDEVVEKIRLKGDPAGYTKVDLDSSSEFKRGGIDCRSLSGPDLKPEILHLHHNKDKNEYLISNTLLEADVILNLPKMKTHKRAGVTLALKNMIGITGDRNWLPHRHTPCRSASSDTIKGAFFRLKKMAIGLLKTCLGALIIPVIDNLRQFIGVTGSCIRRGDWYGNDVIWRTILDVAYIVSYADKKGGLQDKKQRKIFVVVDGIIAGEGDGPVNPRPKPCGVLVAGFNDIAVDVVATRLMGFDPLKIPKFKKISKENLGKLCGFDFKKINCVSNIRDWDRPLEDIKGRCLAFKPHYGWKNNIEF